MFESERKAIIAQISKSDCTKRTIIAVAGPPGAGKSTLAGLLVDDLNESNPGYAALVPMDGFHLDNEVLDARGLRGRKGAPETFDAAGFVKLVRCLASEDETVPYPVFDRKSDRSIPDGGFVSTMTKCIVLEGNYLLLNQKPWNEVQELFDFTVFVRPSLDQLQKRLVRRWLNHGYDAEAAEAKAFGNDIPNARYVLEHSLPADMEI